VLKENSGKQKRTGTIFGIFSILAIVVACLGLLGLSSYAAEQRTKEIGVRKVMGADVPKIVRLLSKEIVLLVGIATIISVPVAGILMANWLESFAFRIKIDPTIFLLAFTGALAIALLTVSFQAVNAALKNPADSLRYE
jgi:putative ABC transport system permease protein